ncbi:AraC family transcriptional regulator [Bacillus sp. LL01]|uniref:response regulator transcription factor n=1 Tax=Bacillus sp. LL01 TaxID=1665556 RepID=UPI00064D4507|nr:response regulator [Bacillus sp. LL01]KMJ57482.1 AraC family transcriptional regulator [Bacillus sp. LL01]
MIKLLIVDDEQIEREGMQAILERSFPGLVIKQAKNGKMAVEMADDFTPDLILMDIKMPGLNGLEAVEQISAKHPKTKFIMVTAYDTFGYVKAAIKLGVKDYVLKPSKISEIKATVGKVLEQIEQEKALQTRSMLQEAAFQKTLTLVETDVVTQLLFDHVHEVHVDMLVEMLDIPSTNEMFVMIVLLQTGSETKYSMIKDKVRLTKSGWVGALYGNQLPIIVFRQPDKTYRSQASSLARDILSIAKKGNDTDWFIGIGEVCSSLDHVRQSYQDALMAAMDTKAPVKFRFYADIHISGDVHNSQLSKNQQKEFAEQIRLGKWNDVSAYVMNLLQCYEKEGANLVHTQQRMLEVLWIASRVINEMGVETATPLYSMQTQDYRQLRSETGHLLDRMKQSCTTHFNRLEADTIQQIKQYIMDHSHEDISLDALARKVGLSPIYISKMFKEKQGINYIDFLTECRMEKAKRLMNDAEKSIKEITFEVGYHDPNYFSKVFKKMTNVSPKEYRKTLLGHKAY